MLVSFVVVLALAGLALFIASRPGEFSVMRQATIAAPPDVIFPHVNDLRNWQGWSPWARMDPGAVTTYDGPAAGEGAGMGWAGQKTGKGHMTIVESRQNELIRMRLDFTKPFVATNTVEFTFRADGPGTHVAWTMHGRSNFMSKAMGLVMNCEKMVGNQYEQGLANLAAVVTEPPATARAA